MKCKIESYPATTGYDYLIRQFLIYMSYSYIIKKNFLPIAFLLSINSTYSQVHKINDPVEWINPLMGTDSKPSLSNGNTYPAVCVPWGMNFGRHKPDLWEMVGSINIVPTRSVA